MNHKSTGLTTLLCLTFIASIGSSASDIWWLRALFGAPLVLFLPGRALLAALRLDLTLGLLLQIALSIGTSLCLTIAGGLALNSLPGGLSHLNWTLYLFGITVLELGIAWGARRQADHQACAVLDISSPSRHSILYGFSVLLLWGAFFVAHEGATAQDHARDTATQLWALPDGDGTIRVGVTSKEPAREQFMLTVTTGDGSLSQDHQLDLAPGETWGDTVTVGTASKENTTIDIVLYRHGDPTPYHRVTLKQTSKS